MKSLFLITAFVIGTLNTLQVVSATEQPAKTGLEVLLATPAPAPQPSPPPATPAPAPKKPLPAPLPPPPNKF